MTERTRIAMPEVGIGFIPDVGGTWLLTRNGGVGIYLALSGATVMAADAIHVGLADMTIDSTSIPELQRRLESIRNASDVDDILSSLARTPGDAVLAAHEPLLDFAMRRDRVEDVIAALVADGSDFARQAAAEIGAKSPTSLKVTHALLKRAAATDRLETCLANEFRAACSLLTSHDLHEGIRAAIIDKDRHPHWSPATLEQVDDAAVAAIMKGRGDPEPVFLERGVT
jgi:enoyl-CoA hydratase